MMNFRRVTTALGVSVVLAAFLAALVWAPTPVSGQLAPKQNMPVVEQPPVVKPDSNAPWSAVKLVENTQYQEWIEVAHACIATKAWKRAVLFLQNILDSKEDYYAEVKRRDEHSNEKVRSVSVKIEANHLLSSMPDEGLNIYELDVGGKAKEMLALAKKKGDRELLAEVAQRFMNTRAGIEANELLATYFLDRGQFFKASLHFERLLSLRESRSKLSDLVLFKAVLAHRRAGDTVNAALAWKRLYPRLKENEGLKLGNELVAIKKLEAVLNDIPALTTTNPFDRPWVGGNLTNTAQARGSPPLLDEILWKRATIRDREDKQEPDPGPEAEKWISDALDTQGKQLTTPVMSGFFPIASGGKLIYRTYYGITAVAIKEIKEADGTVTKPGEVFWKSTPLDGCLSVILSAELNKDVRPNIDNWLRTTYMQSGFINLVYENSMVGTLSTDHKYVFAVDDLAVPIPPNYLQKQIWDQATQINSKTKDLVVENKLQAFEIDTGKLKWALLANENQSNTGPPQNPKEVNELFKNSHWLGAPLPVGGKLYGLNEKNDGTLRLVCLNPATGTVLGPLQELGKVSKDHRVMADISRRSMAVHLAYGEGILVVPTNAGHVFGIDLLTRSLAWAYPYRQSAPAPNSIPAPGPIGFNPNPNVNVGRIMALTYDNWKVAPPMIQDGKLVFTAPDATAVHCINLRDGLPAWINQRQDNDLFLGGIVKDQVVIVGKTNVRFLRLSDGAVMGSLPTGDMPSGQGVASNDIYYLPLRKGEILAIDVPRRLVKAHNVSGKDVNKNNPAPGNLVFYEGAVLSQTPDTIVAYPQLATKLLLANEALEKDPKSLEKRYLRGGLLLADGQVQQAVDDLRSVREQKPPQELMDKVQQKLYEALTTLLQADFNNASVKYLDEYQTLCKLPASDDDRQRREALRLRIIGQGREAQGNLVAAFTAYRQFGSLPLFKQEGVPSLEDPLYKIPTTIWLRARIGSMFVRATPEQKSALEKQIDLEWQMVSAKNDLDQVRSFANLFDVPFKVGREARLRLANTLIDRKVATTYLEAELALQQLRVGEYRSDPRIGGLALEMLARLEKRKAGDDALKQAAAYYRLLNDEFGKVVVRDGKTGQDLFNELTNDKRVLGHLEEDTILWPKADLKYRKNPTTGGLPIFRGFTFQPIGDVSPFLKQHRLILDNFDQSNPMLLLVNPSTGKEAWRVNLGYEAKNQSYHSYLQQQADRNAGFFPNARFRFYRALGHLAVVQVGVVVYGIDAGAGKLLWQYNVLDNQQQHPLATITPDYTTGNPDGTLWYIIQTANGQLVSKTRIGHVGAVEASYVALTSQKGLVVLDPLRGTVMWTKLSVPPQTEIFGDDQHIYLVETAPNGTVAGPGRALRAVDGSMMELKDFGFLFKHRLRVLGRNLLVADPSEGGVTIRLYDVLTGKDLFKKGFENGSVICETEDPYLVGVIDGKGLLTVMDMREPREVCKTNLVQFRIPLESIKTLYKPVLLRDSEHFYVALNQQIDNRKVAGGVVSSNFNNGMRCRIVNGWFCCISGKGEFLWHLSEEIRNQMIVVEQFQTLPVLIFSWRYAHFQPNTGIQQNYWQTAFFSKANEGMSLHWPSAPETTGSAMPKFCALTVDVKNGIISLIGNQHQHLGPKVDFVEQIFIDDGRQAMVGGNGQGVGNAVVVQPAVNEVVVAPQPPRVVLPKDNGKGKDKGKGKGKIKRDP